MTLSAGTKVGPYEVVGALGAGGMGEVYRARDTKLGREVALKVLPEEFASNPERMGRFEREAKVLASLNHPNIAAIYGFEDSGGVHALVMELVEGQTLAEVIAGGQTRSRISSGSGSSGPGAPGTGQSARAGVPAPRKALPIDEALPIAKQIAEGLEYAHERGIVHRDLKPANVKITPDGAVKILDFGLAKALTGETPAADPSASPTLSHLATQAGIILGTASYMAPEQAKGKPVDRRADIWAFGCVLYEMLSGRKPFDGETITDILAAVVRAEPDWSLLPANTPPAIRNLLARCLKKDPRQRLQAIGEARIALEEAASGPAEPTAAPSPAAPRAPALQAPWRRALPWAGMLVLAAVAAIFAFQYETRAPRPAPAVISQILPPAGQAFSLNGNVTGPPSLSPDGSKLAFAAVGPDGKQQLWVQTLSSPAAVPLAETDGAMYPFWSPDGRDLGFFANGKLKRINASGGPPLTLCDAPSGRGGAWNESGTILFTPDLAATIYRVAASGGVSTRVVDKSTNTGSNRWPQFLPDGMHFLFYDHSDTPGESGTFVGSLEGGQPKLLLRGASNAVFAPPGYLLFIRQGTLMAERFDLKRLRLQGPALPLAQNVVDNFLIFRAMFTVSATGTLVFQGGNSGGGNSQLLWFDRNGKQIGQAGTTGAYYTPRLSPDGSKLAVSIGGAAGNNIWVFDLTRGISTRITFSQNDLGPAWSPDGKTITFESGRGMLFNLYQKAADGSGKTTPLLVDNADEYDPVWSADGRYLVFERRSRGATTHLEIWAMPTFGDRKPFPVVQGRFSVSQPSLSPDGRWLAYLSTESGQPQVYAQTFPHGSERWQVSAAGGDWPLWSRNGKELFYISADDKVVSASITEAGSRLIIGKDRPLFQTNALIGPGWPYDVSADGKKFVVANQKQAQTSQPLTLVINWPSLLKGQR